MDICIYHGNSADGFGAAFAVWKKLGDSCKYIPGIYGTPPPVDSVRGKDVVLVDFSYKKDVMRDLVTVAKSVTVLDHHKTAQEDLMPLFKEGLVKGIFDMDRSGAVIAWEWFHPEERIPRLFRHIQDRDLWNFDLGGTSQIQAALFSYPYSFTVWEQLVERCERNANELITEGTVIERKQMKDIQEFIEATQHTMEIGGYMVPVLNAPYFWSSEAGHLMCVGHPFAACYWRTRDGWTFSLRSTNAGIDVSEIALKYGGGGHRNAAGFQVESFSEL